MVIIIFEFFKFCNTFKVFHFSLGYLIKFIKGSTVKFESNLWLIWNFF